MRWIEPELDLLADKWRTRWHFAWLPVRMTLPDKNVIVWLEWYQSNDRKIGKDAWYTCQRAPKGYWNR